MRTAALLVAHQGGWDELLFVLLPIALFAVLLAVANRRATREQADREQPEPEPPAPPPRDTA
jgi:hypothetical protein